MVFVRVWPPVAAVPSSRHVVPRAVNACQPEPIGWLPADELQPGEQQAEARQPVVPCSRAAAEAVTGMTLPRQSRLCGQPAFRNVFQHPAVSADASFKVLARSNQLPYSRLGLAVSRQVDRRAVERNRLKRIVRESFRAHYLAETGRTSVDIVVLPRRQAVSICNRQLFEALDRHWARIDRRLERQQQADAQDAGQAMAAQQSESANTTRQANHQANR